MLLPNITINFHYTLGINHKVNTYKKNWKNNLRLTFFNITEYPYGVTQHPPKGSPIAALYWKCLKYKTENKPKQLIKEKENQNRNYQHSSNVCMYVCTQTLYQSSMCKKAKVEKRIFIRDIHTEILIFGKVLWKLQDKLTKQWKKLDASQNISKETHH